MIMLVHDFLARSAARTPDAPAVVERGRTFTYARLAGAAARVAALLAGTNVSRGERVVLALENSFDFIAAYFGILQTGAVAVPLAPGARSDRLRKAVRDCAPAACIVDDATWAMLRGADAPPWRAAFVRPRRGAFTPGPGDAGVADFAAAVAGASAPPVRALDEADLAAIIYTSGSTGDPRGVMLTHRNIAANTRSIVQYLALGPGDRVMVVLPFHYVYGLSLLHTHVAAGGAVVLDNRFLFPNVVLESMREHAVTGFAGVPSTFALLLHRSRLADMQFPALRYVTQAGGPMPPARVREWRRVLPDVPFFIMYGATEASARLAYLPPEELDRRPGSIGRAIPGVDLRVIREDGRAAASGEVGELVARGENISPGYWNAPEETRARFGPDGYRTGDLGYADEDGFLYLVGRRQDILKVGGERVGAQEVESVLHEHPDVHEAAVVGVEHELLGEVPVAFVSLCDRRDATVEALDAFCRSRLPDYKVPARIVVLRELPRSPIGKIDKGALRAAAAGGGAVLTSGA